jgi:hypothetical protein
LGYNHGNPQLNQLIYKKFWRYDRRNEEAGGSVEEFNSGLAMNVGDMPEIPGNQKIDFVK